MGKEFIGCTKNFWCAWIHCKSYNNGSECSTCDKYGKCENCILEGTEDKPDGCEDEEYYISYGYPEEVE